MNTRELLVPPGLTPIEATSLLHREFPDVPQWTFVYTDHNPAYSGVDKMLGLGFQMEGRAGKWNWRRLGMRYPNMTIFAGKPERRKRSPAWVGAIEVTAPDSRTFIVFTYLSHRDEFCSQYLFSTDDAVLIDRFMRDMTRLYMRRRTDKARICMMNGPDVLLDCHGAGEQTFLTEQLRADIDGQVDGFFNGKALFERVGAPYKRGFLFVGPPGTGKTMTIRSIVRRCHERYRVKFFSMVVSRKTDMDDLSVLFSLAQDSAPAMIILEDMESLTRESMVTRSALLAQLDGLNSSKGILVVGTTNNPDHVDPALLHRPSRFDRVWHFPVPDTALRRKYLAHYCADAGEETIDVLVKGTSDWSFAYLNELKTTAALIAARSRHETVAGADLLEAHGLLDAFLFPRHRLGGGVVNSSVSLVRGEVPAISRRLPQPGYGNG